VSDFGALIKSKRQALGWSLRVAATQIGVSSSRLSEVERGRSYHTDGPTRPSRELVERIAIALRMPPDVALAEAGYPARAPTSLAPDSSRLLALYESLSPDRKAVALEIMRVLSDVPAEVHKD
jgi:transcriptional regulator with XRE-family HTH domain